MGRRSRGEPHCDRGRLAATCAKVAAITARLMIEGLTRHSLENTVPADRERIKIVVHANLVSGVQRRSVLQIHVDGLSPTRRSACTVAHGLSPSLVAAAFQPAAAPPPGGQAAAPCTQALCFGSPGRPAPPADRDRARARRPSVAQIRSIFAGAPSAAPRSRPSAMIGRLRVVGPGELDRSGPQLRHRTAAWRRPRSRPSASRRPALVGVTRPEDNSWHRLRLPGAPRRAWVAALAASPPPGRLRRPRDRGRARCASRLRLARGTA
jgi:hypothetical protein